MSNTYRYTLNSTFEESEKVPDIVEEIADECSLNDEDTGNFMLLLSEAVTNAIEHGNENDPKKKVIIHIEINSKEITASVQDEGIGFNPQATKDPLEEKNLLDISGRGLFLLNEIADSVTYSENGTKLSFSLHRK
ncbi:MAG: ATP-binding protein [Balneolaceae bacterium]